jgi:hypothetical protein
MLNQLNLNGPINHNKEMRVLRKERVKISGDYRKKNTVRRIEIYG